MLPPWIQGHYPIDAIAKDPLFTATAIGRSFASEPLGFVDIGARGGVHDLVAPIARHAAVLGFEPDEAACSELNILMASSKTWARARCLPVALSNVDGPGTLHLCAAPTNHSLLPVNTEFADRYRMDKFAQTGSFPLKTQILDSTPWRPNRAGASFSRSTPREPSSRFYREPAGRCANAPRRSS
jgi:hypothetical protein